MTKNPQSKMTPRQSEIYNFILSYEKKHGYVPNNIQIAKKIGVTYQSIQQIIGQLTKKGKLKPKEQILVGAYEIVREEKSLFVKEKERNLKMRQRVSSSRWVRRNPAQRKAHRSVFIALRNGTLEKKNCIVCGEKKSEAHHDDYSKPLDVLWLCKRHHTERHLFLKNIPNTTIVRKS